MLNQCCFKVGPSSTTLIRSKVQHVRNFNTKHWRKQSGISYTKNNFIWTYFLRFSNSIQNKFSAGIDFSRSSFNDNLTKRAYERVYERYAIHLTVNHVNHRPMCNKIINLLTKMFDSVTFFWNLVMWVAIATIQLSFIFLDTHTYIQIVIILLYWLSYSYKLLRSQTILCFKIITRGYYYTDI